MARHSSRLLGLVFVLAFGAQALGATLAGVALPDTVEVAGQKLVLNGMGIRKATILKVKVYVAGLYLGSRSSDPKQILGATTKRVVLRFVRDVDRNDIVKAWAEGFKKNGGSSPALAPRVAQLNGWMADMKEGKSLVFTQAASSVEVSVAGVVKGKIQGDDFAAALFSIWLGPDPPNEELKSGLLGKYDR
jgi:hypothetical protein